MNSIGENYCTAHHLAVQRDGGWDDFELVRFLLKNGANPNIRDSKCDTALSLAVRRKGKQYDILESSAVNKGCKYIIKVAIGLGRHDAAQLIEESWVGLPELKEEQYKYEGDEYEDN